MFHALFEQHHLLLKAASPEVVAAASRIFKHILLNGPVSVPAGFFLKGVVCVFGQADVAEAGPLVVEKIQEAAQTLNLVQGIHQGMEKMKAEVGGQKSETGGQQAESDAPPSESEAARVFALMKSLEDGKLVRKAPLLRVFRLLVLDGLSQNAVARECGCSISLVSLRAKEIERRMNSSVTVLRTLASRVGELVSVEDSRARKIYHRGLTDDAGEEDG